MKAIKKWTPIILTWRDAVTVREEMHSEHLEDATPIIRRSIGFLLKMNKNEVVICMEDDRAKDDGHDDCQTVTGLPRGMVIAIRPLADAPFPAPKNVVEP